MNRYYFQTKHGIADASARTASEAEARIRRVTGTEESMVLVKWQERSEFGKVLMDTSSRP